MLLLTQKLIRIRIQIYSSVILLQVVAATYFVLSALRHVMLMALVHITYFSIEGHR